MKKVLSFVLVLSLVLGSFGMAFAATPSDVVGQKSETAVSVLVNMGIINGYTDGTYKPEGIVTRAEMAKILVTALGLGKMVPSTTSSFTDMAGHWANGYVAYAASLGIVAGYPDGTFKPDATVTYEEAATMMVRSLGYDDRALIGTWPGNYVSKALALGLYKNVAAAAGGATRGDIALMVYELLDEEMGKVTDDGKVFEGNGDSMLKINSAYLDADDDNVADAADTNKAGFDITESYNTSSKSLIDLTPYIGQRVYVYKNKDNKIIAIAKIKSTSLTGKFDKDAATGMKLNVAGKDYDVVLTGIPTVAGNAAISNVITNTDISKGLYNGAAGLNAGTQKNIQDLDEMTITINGKLDGLKITPYTINVWTANSTELVATGDVYDIEDVLSGDISTLFGQSLPKDNNSKVDFTKFDVVGTTTKLADIKKDDIVEVYLNNAGEIARLRVSNKIVEGKVTKNDGTYVTINGEAFKVDAAALGGPVIGNALFTPGATTKAWVAGSGKIVKASKVSAAASGEYALVTEILGGLEGTATKPSIKLLTAKGEMKTFAIKSTADYINAADATGKLVEQTLSGVAGTAYSLENASNALAEVIPGAIVTYKTNASGEITEMTMEAVKVDVAAAYNSRTSKLSVTGHTYDIASNVVVFKSTGTDSKVIALKDVNDSVNGIDPTGGVALVSSPETIYVLNSDNDVVAMAILPAGVYADTKFAAVIDRYSVYSESDDTNLEELKVLTADGEATYMVKKGDALNGNITKGDLINLGLVEGRLTQANTAQLQDRTNDIKADLGTVTAVDADKFDITTTGGAINAYEYYDNTVFYVATFKADNSFDKWVLGDAYDVRVNALVAGYDVNEDGEKFIDDSNATISEVFFIVKSADVAKIAKDM